MQQIPFLLNQMPTSAPVPSPAPLPTKLLGTTYTMAQSVRWVSQDMFAIGRWDGTLTLYRMRGPEDFTPVVVDALFAPSLAGIEMIARIQDGVFTSSNDGSSIEVWKQDPASGSAVPLWTLNYDSSFGVANDGIANVVDGQNWFSTSHSNGFLLVWKLDGAGKPVLSYSVDLKSSDPIASPFPLKNIRGVERFQGTEPGRVVAASEDGDLTLINILTGEVLERARYNPTAQRGINDIDVLGDYLLLGNCSVGAGDKNLWLYSLKAGKFDLLDSLNLRVDESLPQVFNFCVDQALVDGKQYFFAATQEGVVWIGQIENDRLKVLGREKVSTGLGAAMAYEPNRKLLAVAGDNIHLFEVG